MKGVPRNFGLVEVALNYRPRALSSPFIRKFDEPLECARSIRAIPGSRDFSCVRPFNSKGRRRKRPWGSVPLYAPVSVGRQSSIRSSETLTLPLEKIHISSMPTTHRFFGSSSKVSQSEKRIRASVESREQGTVRKLQKTLSKFGQVYPVKESNIEVLLTPTEFYERLLREIESATSKITLASLYLGTSVKEAEIVKSLKEALRKNGDLKVRIMLDYSRGRRLVRGVGGVKNDHLSSSSLKMLDELVGEFPGRIEVSLFRMPALEKAFMKRLPSPYDETVGVFHMKAYVFDDTLIMSGANLSEDYFTNRQDRYMVFKNEDNIANFYHNVVEALSQFTFHYCLNESGFFSLLPPVRPSRELASALECLFMPRKASEGLSAGCQEGTASTWVMPTTQMGSLHVDQDTRVIHQLLDFVDAQTTPPRLSIASGYLNFPPQFSGRILRSSATVHVLTASPQANGFFRAPGIKGAVAMAYNIIAREFYQQCQKTRRKDGWTFHAKGLWCTLGRGHGSAHINDDSINAPLVCAIGSPNFGRRSFERDIESQSRFSGGMTSKIGNDDQVALALLMNGSQISLQLLRFLCIAYPDTIELYICTASDRLTQRLLEEKVYLFQSAAEVTSTTFEEEERQLSGISLGRGIWIKPVAKLIASFF